MERNNRKCFHYYRFKVQDVPKLMQHFVFGHFLAPKKSSKGVQETLLCVDVKSFQELFDHFWFSMVWLC